MTDEYLSLHAALHTPREIIFRHRAASNPNILPPLYDLLLHFWLRIFGTAETAQRSLSALSGVISVYIIYRLGRMLFDVKTGILAALFSAASFSWFYCFRQNRCYGLTIALTLVSFYLLFVYLRKRHSLAVYLSLAAVNLLLIYTHYFAVFVIFLEASGALFFLKTRRKESLRLLLMPVWVFFFFAPWLPNLLYDIGREPAVFHRVVTFDIKRVLYDAYMLVFFDFHVRWEPILAFLYIPFIIRGWRRMRALDAQQGDCRAVMLACIILVSFAAIYALTLSGRPRYYCPYYFPLSLFLAVGVQGIRREGVKSVLYPGACAAIAFCNITDFHDFFRRPLYENWRLSAQIVKSIPGYRSREMVFLFQTRYNPPVFAWYFWDMRLSAAFADKISTREGYEKDLMERGISRHKVYFINDEAMKAADFPERLSVFPADAWIWIFRYHQRYAYQQLHIQTRGKYLIHQIKLNEEIPQIDLFLLKRI